MAPREIENNACLFLKIGVCLFVFKDRRFITPSVQLFSMNSLFSSQIWFRNFRGRKKHSPCMVFAQLELYKF